MPVLVATMAGEIAECLVNPAALGLGGTTDRKFAYRLAAMAICRIQIQGERGTISEDETRDKESAINLAIEDASLEARRLIERNIRAVHRVAELLIRRGKVSGREVAAIVGDSQDG